MFKRLLKRKSNKGFTLVELIIVIVILAILIGVTIGGIYRYVADARKNTDANNASAMQSVVSTLVTNREVYNWANKNENKNQIIKIKWNKACKNSKEATFLIGTDLTDGSGMLDSGNAGTMGIALVHAAESDPGNIVFDSGKKLSDLIDELFPDGLPAPKAGGYFELTIIANDGNIAIRVKAYTLNNKEITGEESGMGDSGNSGVTPTSHDAGLYDKDWNLLKSWDELLSENYLTLSDGKLDSGSTIKNAYSNGTTDTLIPFDAKLVMSDDVTSMNTYCFACSGAWMCYLGEVHLSKNLTTLPNGCFDNCVALTTVVGLEHINSIGKYAFEIANPSNQAKVNTLDPGRRGLEGDLVLGEGMTVIEGCTFSNCNITSVTIPDSVTEIGDQAFGYCNNLKSVKLSSNLKKLGYHSFDWYQGTISSIDLPDNIESMTNSSFGTYNAVRNSSGNVVEQGVNKDSNGIAYGYTENINIKVGSKTWNTWKAMAQNGKAASIGSAKINGKYYFDYTAEELQ